MTQPPLNPPPGQNGVPAPQGYVNGIPPVPQGSRPAGAPPPRFAPQPQAQARPHRVELGLDPELEQRRRRPMGLIVGLVASGVAVVALVVSLVVAFTLPDDTTVPGGVADPQAPVSTPIPTSTLTPASPTDAVPGYIPITQDVVFPDGVTIVNPPVGDWEPDVSERQPNMFILTDDRPGAYFSVAQEDLHENDYRDEDLTRADLNTSNLQFTNNPDKIGDPVPFTIKGQGYELELLAQNLRWSDGSEGMVASRFMPSTGTKITVMANAGMGELSDPTSRISQKLAEITFTVP